MKTTIAVSLLALLSLGATANDEGTPLKVNTEKSKIYWTGKKVTGEHTGTLSIKSGEVVVLSGKPQRLNLELDMNSITCTDITDSGTNAKLIGHLKSDDFFSVEKNPTGTFKATSFQPISGASDREPNYVVKGDLTLKGITQPVEFSAFISSKGDMMVANGDVQFDRTKFDIHYGSGSFFKGLGDKAINDTVSLNFVFSAGK